MSDRYQGHHSDGSGIQNHSCGFGYPYVLQLRDNPAGGFFWEVVGPGIDGAIRFEDSESFSAAVRRLHAVRDSDDAWAFELERLCLFGGVSVHPMRAAAAALGEPTKWKDMSKLRRVQVLLALGKMRNTLQLPVCPYAVFAQYARRIV